MAKQDKELIEALKQELKHYEIYKKADRAKQVKEAIKKLVDQLKQKLQNLKLKKK